MQSTHPIRATGLFKTYGSGDAAVRALDGITLDVERGSFTAVMGPSGCGKSTLLHAVAGLESVDAGSVHIDGHDLTAMSERARTRLRRTTLGFVFQSFNLVPALTALENIELPMRLARTAVDAAWRDELTAALGLTGRLHHRPAELSGGQQQRVAVARALLPRPQVVFADEPTGALDSRSGTELLTLIRRAVEDYGQTVVMVTHDAAAAACADGVVFLRDGRLVSELRAPTAEAIRARMATLQDRATVQAVAA